MYDLLVKAIATSLNNYPKLPLDTTKIRITHGKEYIGKKV